jgi:hypothetical protein
MGASCPVCGAPVRFTSPAPYTVCAYCNSLLVRRDVSLESLGRVASVPDDFSPFKLGTSGTFEKQPFTLVGRIRKTWSEGSWNEWCALFPERRLGWLAEAQGDLVMTFERPGALDEQQLGPLDRLNPDAIVPLDGRRFQVSDIKQVQCAAAEGELASFALDLAPMTCIDLRGPGVSFATLERSDRLHVFIGRFIEFEECRFTGLRQMDGWSSTSPSP